MRSIFGEIWRIPHRGVIINGDDGKDYVLLCDQKIRYIFFPFLLWVCPLEFIEVKKDSIRQARDNSWVMSIAPAIALTIGPIGGKTIRSNFDKYSYPNVVLLDDGVRYWSSITNYF